MRFIYALITLMFSTFSFSQSNFNSIGINTDYGQIKSLGFVFERYIFNEDDNDYSTIGLSMNYLSNTVDVNNFEIDGQGVGINAFLKGHWGDLTSGFYTKYRIEYGNIHYNESLAIDNLELVKYKGSYNYLSFFSPEIGYEWIVLKHFRLGVFAGAQWQIELKGKANIDNKDFDNWIYRMGLRLNYDLKILK